MQVSLVELIEARRKSPASYPQGRFEGRGIVICAGGERYFTCAWVLIHVLRRVHQITLPIQVWHLGRREMSEEMRLLLAEEGVETVDAKLVTARYPAQIAGGWPLKPYAIAHSRFREVLYLDADTVPLVDPQIAFTWDAYRETGLLLWPDVVDIKKTNPIWARLDLKPIEQASVESGVMVADKSRVWGVLDLAVLMNEHWEEIYDVLYGDKDTFLVSTRLLDKAYGFIGPRPFRFGWDIVQRDIAGEPFIHHRTGSKWQLNHDNRPMAEPALMPHCEAALADLRSRWSGRVFHAPERSARARAEESRLVAVRRFRYEPAVGGTRDMDLCSGARVGGHGPAHHWAVIERDGALMLQLYSGRQLSAELMKSDDTTWEGRSTTPGFEVRLQDRAAPTDGSYSGEPALRSARELVRPLLEAALLAVGYAPRRAAQLESALSLLNGTFDDLPETLVKETTQHSVSAAWQEFLVPLASKLALMRDDRLAQLSSREIGPVSLNPSCYARRI